LITVVVGSDVSAVVTTIPASSTVASPPPPQRTDGVATEADIEESVLIAPPRAESPQLALFGAHLDPVERSEDTAIIVIVPQNIPQKVPITSRGGKATSAAAATAASANKRQKLTRKALLPTTADKEPAPEEVVVSNARPVRSVRLLKSSADN
jgi:hypothetical protein